MKQPFTRHCTPGNDSEEMGNIKQTYEIGNGLHEPYDCPRFYLESRPWHWKRKLRWSPTQSLSCRGVSEKKIGRAKHLEISGRVPGGGGLNKKDLPRSINTSQVFSTHI